jgi:hypothetical protein
MPKIDISKNILTRAQVDHLVVGDVEAAAYGRGAQSFDEARAVSQASIRDLVERGLATIGHWKAHQFVTTIVSVGESFDRFIAAWNAGEDEYAIGLVALTEQGDALAADLRARRDNCKQGVAAALVARLAVHHGSARATYEKLSLFDLVREAARAPSHPRRQLSPAIAVEAFSILDNIYQHADADTQAVIEDELFEFEPGSSFDWIEPRVAPALLSAVGRYRRVLALVAPHY